MDTSITDFNHDPTIGINDGQSFYGFIAHEQTTCDCDALQGDSSTSTLKNIVRVTSPNVSSQRYSSEIKIQFKSAEKWGSCHTGYDEGHTIFNSCKCIVDQCSM